MAKLFGIVVLVALATAGSVQGFDHHNDNDQRSDSNEVPPPIPEPPDLTNDMMPLPEHWGPHGPMDWFPHQPMYPHGYPPATGAGSSAPEDHRVVCASMPWKKGLVILPGLVCEVNCCQRGDKVECCEETNGVSKLSIAMVSAACGLVLLAMLCAAFVCYKHKMSRKRKTRPTPNTPLSILPAKVSVISYGPDFAQLPRKTKKQTKYEVPETKQAADAPPTYSQYMLDVASPPPPYSAQSNPENVMDGPVGTVEINSAPMNTRFPGRS